MRVVRQGAAVRMVHGAADVRAAAGSDAGGGGLDRRLRGRLSAVRRGRARGGRRTERVPRARVQRPRRLSRVPGPRGRRRRVLVGPGRPVPRAGGARQRRRGRRDRVRHATAGRGRPARAVRRLLQGHGGRGERVAAAGRRDGPVHRFLRTRLRRRARRTVRGLHVDGRPTQVSSRVTSDGVRHDS